jgi:hydroxyacylglutathione hydrolase
VQLLIKYLCVGPWKENAYLVAYNNEAWLIDPGDEFEKLDDFFEISKYKLNGIINTHGHFDHVGAVAKFKEKYKVPFYLHSKDKQILKQANLYSKLAGGKNLLETPLVDFFLDDHSVLDIAGKKINIHYTPGHSNGSVCFEIDGNLVSGDILIKGLPGRTDLPGGNKELIKSSITYILENFNDSMLYPGHGQPFLLDNATINILKGTF